MNAIPHRLRLGVIIVLIGCGALAEPALPPTPPPAPATRADLAEARRLTEAREFSASRQLFERYLAQKPDDADAHFFYGLCLNLEAAATDDPTAAAALRRRVREQMLTAQKLGSQEPLVTMVLDTINADGTRATKDRRYSTDQVTNSLMKTAEAAFAKGDFARAADLHRQALLLEPGNYLAALYCGDAYFAAEDYSTAGGWFAKAVAINPDIETAHRYWADALARQGKFDEATSHYIDAVVAEPYNSLTRTRFREYAGSAGFSLRTDPVPLPPAAVTMNAGKVEIQLASGQDPYTGALGLAYATACVKVRTQDFGRLYPKEKQPRRSLPEEVAGLRTMLQVARELAEAKPEKNSPAEIARWQPSLEILNQLQHADLVAAFALLERADQELAQDYAAYRAAHRDKLVQFVRVYWCGLN
jgi:tetratricopeptide (TPR) repeat protein